MATKLPGVLGSVASMVHVSSVHWFEDFNLGRPTKEYGDLSDKGELFQSLRDHDWRENGDAIIEVEAIEEEWRQRAIAERTNRWEELKQLAKADHTKSVDKDVWEELYTENGKLRPIHYIGISGNRRSKVYFNAMVARRKMDLPLRGTIPVIVKTFEGDAKTVQLERLWIQILENDQKKVGFQDPSPIDRLYQAKYAYERGADQNWMRKLWGATSGQKYFAVVKANAHFPGLRIYDRMMAEPNAHDYLNLRALKGDKLTTLLKRLPGKALDKENAELKLKGKELTKPLTEDEVAEFLSEIGRSGSNAPKIMARKAIEDQAEQCPCLPARSVLKGVLAGNADTYEYMIRNQGAFNALDSLVNNNNGPAVEMILTEFVTSPNGVFRDNYLTKMVQLSKLVKTLDQSPGQKDKDKLIEQIGEVVTKK